MPEGAVCVTRGTPWGNPFTITEKVKPGTSVGGAVGYVAVPTLEDAIACFRILATETPEKLPPLEQLRGKDLACWCRLDQACHADVLLELANR